MTQTSNYELNKFESTDKMNPTTLNGLNDNADKIDTALAGLNTNKQNKLTAGTNISISGNTISATDTTYNDATTTVAGLMSTADKTKLDNTFKVLTSPVRIWDLDDGTYQLPNNCVIYYLGQYSTTSFTLATSGLLFVTHNDTYKYWFVFCGQSTTRFIYNGYLDANSGTLKSFSVGTTYLTSISSYVKDSLNYSTAGTTYALSAYQGYLLDQKIGNVETILQTLNSGSGV